ncbi:hypothetical protein [Massilia niastensis]|uniref:hypothetical protein n=1 Tax=Massilia niastensis TaxID=544911 RepID=UPI00037FEB2B|nr:hypothetical protein [Massilia niastensis]
MGYHLTILRSSAQAYIPISLAEAKLAALKLGWIYADQPPTFSRHTDQGVCTLWHQDGELWTNNPETWEICHLLVLAEVLGARLRGDEHETYETPDKTYTHPDDLRLAASAQSASDALLSRSAREQALIRNLVVLFFGVLAVGAYVLGKWFERGW